MFKRKHQVHVQIKKRMSNYMQLHNSLNINNVPLDK